MNRIPPSLDPLPPQPTPAPAQPARFGRVERLHEILHRHRFILAPLSFAIGVASFFLVTRKVYLAQWLAILLLATWLFSVLELALPRSLRLPQGLLRFITQQTHQEAFFFTLPFLWKTTTWYTGQAFFTGGVIVAAICSMWDPLYFGVIATRRWVYLLFHALAVYVVMLIALPMLLQLTTSQTLALAAIAVALLAAPSLAQPPERADKPIGLFIFAMGLALGAAAWIGRAYVPAGTLWVSDAAITTTIDTEAKTPGADLSVVSASDAAEHGVYAFTAIRAPRGLAERVFHDWYADGKFVVSVPLDITGNREQGYRTWSHKTGFSGSPERWRVRVVTESGQLLGELRFTIEPGATEPQRDQPEVAPMQRDQSEVAPMQSETPAPEAPAQQSAPTEEAAPEESAPQPAEPETVPPPQEATPAPSAPESSPP